jgi:hypothetical protein
MESVFGSLHVNGMTQSGMFCGNAIFHWANGTETKINQPSTIDENEMKIKIPLKLNKNQPSTIDENRTKIEIPLKLNTRKCASWVPSQDRKVLFVGLSTWADFYAPGSSSGGEDYVSATWDYALRRNGFQVVGKIDMGTFQQMTDLEMRSYYRFFFNGPATWHPHFRYRDILCRARPMDFFGRWQQKGPEGRYDPKQIVTPYDGGFLTYMGYFPHNLLNTTTSKAERGRVGFLLGKHAKYFVPHQAVIQRLISEGFSLHATCRDHDSIKCPFPAEVTNHQYISPSEYAKLMSSFSFMLGFQHVSETLEGYHY